MTRLLERIVEWAGRDPKEVESDCPPARRDAA